MTNPYFLEHGDTDLLEGESFRMLHDLMLVRRYDGDKVTDGGLIIPDKAQEPSCHGTVISAGPGLVLNMEAVDEEGGMMPVREPMEVQEGDVVMYDGSSGINAREYRKGSGIILVAQRDVLFTAIEKLDEDYDPADHEPHGRFFAGPDEDGYWPVGEHLPRWLRERHEECSAKDLVIISHEKVRGL